MNLINTVLDYFCTLINTSFVDIKLFDIVIIALTLFLFYRFIKFIITSISKGIKKRKEKRRNKRLLRFDDIVCYKCHLSLVDCRCEESKDLSFEKRLKKNNIRIKQEEKSTKAYEKGQRKARKAEKRKKKKEMTEVGYLRKLKIKVCEKLGIVVKEKKVKVKKTEKPKVEVKATPTKAKTTTVKTKTTTPKKTPNKK